MRFAVLGSGSRGNATLIECGGTRILLDCGFPLREIERRLAPLDAGPAEIAAIVVTHEHGDHIAGVERLAARYDIEVWTSPGTWKGAGCPDIRRLRLFSGHGRGFRIACRLGVLTDAGTVTPRVRDALQDCHALMLEANHDPQMLQTGPYPPSLRQRVGGPFGHLSNRQAAELLDAVHHAGLRQVLLSHISAQNNRPDLALTAVHDVDRDLAASLLVAEQDQGTGWLEL
jgi:phosphoribosyl 1,2-cyclic phosphodiesterase